MWMSFLLRYQIWCNIVLSAVAESKCFSVMSLYPKLPLIYWAPWSSMLSSLQLDFTHGGCDWLDRRFLRLRSAYLHLPNDSSRVYLKLLVSKVLLCFCIRTWFGGFFGWRQMRYIHYIHGQCPSIGTWTKYDPPYQGFRNTLIAKSNKWMGNLICLC